MTQEKFVDLTCRLMRELSALSDSAKAAEESDLMHAANRAWGELYEWQKKGAKSKLGAR